MRRWRSLSLGVALLAMVLVAIQAWKTYPRHLAPSNPPPHIVAHPPHPATVRLQPPPLPTVVSTPAELPDQVELGAENVDRLHTEYTDLASRKQDLDSQLADSEALIKLKAQRIKQLQQQLQKTPPRAP
ncbi:MAG: hypothetical protein HKM02_06960 [Pseudomonadales bacterium]|nr:hypothetical protein [Pseudomonadales bacterium]